jgi:hypothetical protein
MFVTGDQLCVKPPTPRSRGFPESLVVVQVVNKLPSFVDTKVSLMYVHNSLPPATILSEINQIRTFKHYLHMNNSNIILPSPLRSSQMIGLLQVFQPAVELYQFFKLTLPIIGSTYIYIYIYIYDY